jgi:hypothetical protein
MVNQTERTFGSRTGSRVSKTTTPSAAGPSNALARNSSCSSIVIYDEVAPSELEIYNQVGLLPKVNGERVGCHRKRTDENELRLSTHIVSILRRLEQEEQRSSAQHREVLLRIQDIAQRPPATSSSPTNVSAELVADLARVKTMTNEGRTAIVALTAAVNDLVDIPGDLRDISTSIRELRASIASTTSTATAQRNNNSEQNAYSSNSSTRNSQPQQSNHSDAPSGRDSNGNGKRSNTFPAADSAAKRFRPENPHYCDVYFWDVDTSSTSPAKIAYLAMDRLGMNSTNAIISVQKARNTPDSVISIRFRRAEVAEEFIDRLRANPPDGMGNLHAAKPAVYEKRNSNASDKRGSAAKKDPW